MIACPNGRPVQDVAHEKRDDSAADPHGGESVREVRGRGGTVGTVPQRTGDFGDGAARRVGGFGALP